MESGIMRGFFRKLHGTTPSGWTPLPAGYRECAGSLQVRELSGAEPEPAISLLDSGLPEPPVVAGTPFSLSAWFELPQCCFGMLLTDQCAAAPVEMDADRRFATDITGFCHSTLPCSPGPASRDGQI